MPAGTQRCLPAQGWRAPSGGQEHKTIRPAHYITGRAGAGLASIRQTHRDTGPDQTKGRQPGVTMSYQTQKAVAGVLPG
ncbi:hypothetical protein CBM2585_A60155 [Cupriavidus taiwanensis]|nr:hypothetical protein CBM2585_A60155 [Cupriavidus taiwanensis]